MATALGHPDEILKDLDAIRREGGHRRLPSRHVEAQNSHQGLAHHVERLGEAAEEGQLGEGLQGAPRLDVHAVV